MLPSNVKQRQNVRMVLAVWGTLLLLWSLASSALAQTAPNAEESSRQPPGIKLVLRVKPRDDSGRFHLQINGETVAADVGSGGQSAVAALGAGVHTVSIIASGQTRLSDYKTAIICRRERVDDDEDDDQINAAQHTQQADDSSKVIARANNATSLTLELADDAAVTCTFMNRRRDDDEPGEVPPPDERPTVRVEMTDFLYLDTNNNDLVNTGDTLIYGVTIVNVGSRPATDLLWELRPESDTALLTDSLYTNKGAVLAGNRSGDSQIRINIGDLGVGERVTINFAVRVAGSLASNQVANQSVITLRDNATNAVYSVSSDDPDTPLQGDATVTPVAEVTLHVFMPAVARR